MSLTEKAVSIFKQSLSYVDPGVVIPNSISWNKQNSEITIGDHIFSVKKDQPIYIIGAGKASARMAAAVEDVFKNRITDGIVISPDATHKDISTQVFKGSHPLPDKESLSSSYELVSFIQKIPEDAFVFNLISGGTSSLFCLPAGNLEIEDIRQVYSLLIESGATIHEINTVRKVFSSVKGGQILKYLEKTQLVDLMISDITDDDIRMIGSGPSVAQSISATDGFQILKKYGLYNSIPHSARHFLAVEMDKEVKHSEYRTTSDFERHTSIIISSASMLARKAGEIVKDEGFKLILNENAWSGPIEKLSDQLTSQIEAEAGSAGDSKAIVSFGEPTVKVTGDGLGGRNQELALRMAISLKNLDHPVAFLSAGTDGIDGPTDAAGAVVSNETYEQAREKGVSPEEFLDTNDSYTFFDRTGGHLKPGPTGNNLMDLHIVLIE